MSSARNAAVVDKGISRVHSASNIFTYSEYLTDMISTHLGEFETFLELGAHVPDGAVSVDVYAALAVKFLKYIRDEIENDLEIVERKIGKIELDRAEPGNKGVRYGTIVGVRLDPAGAGQDTESQGRNFPL